MQAGALVGSDVQAFTSRVLVNGTSRPVMSWSVDRDIVGDLPEQVVAGGGVKQATGSIEWAADADLSDGSLNPWNPSTGWIPVEGDTVDIFAGDGVSEWRQFTGVIDTSSGTIGGGFTSRIVDRIDDLSVRANLPALVDVMPPLTPTGDFRRFRLSPRWVIQQSLRRAGFYATPAPEAHTVLDVPAFGGMWPYIGSMIRCARGSDASSAPIWPNGTHVADLNAAYAPSGPRTGAQPVQLTMNIAAAHKGVTTMQVLYGASHIILRATTANVLFMVNNTVICNVPRTGDVVAQAFFSGGTARLRTSTGQDATGTAAWSVSSPTTEVRIVADVNSLVNGFVVSHPQQPWHEFANIEWTATVNIASGAMQGVQAALKATRGQSVREVLDDVSGALLWPHWIDENGVMQVIQSDIMRGRGSAQTVTTLDDVRELDWEKTLLGVRSQIVMSYDRATINRRKDYSLPVHESAESVVLKSGEEHVSLISPGSDEWLMLDTSAAGVDDTANINAGIGTWVGGVYTDGVTERWTNLVGHQIDVSFAEVGDGTWKITHTAKTLDPGWQVELRSVSGDFMGSTVLWPNWWEKNLPIARAKGSFGTTTVTRTPSIAGNRGPALEHSCGLWATGATDATETTVVDAIADFLSGQVASPQPTITNLRVGFDPRRQLGDVITISSPNFMGVTLTCLIVGKHDSAGASYQQSLTVRVIDATTTFTTYAGFAEAWGPSADYDSFAAAWDAISTYTDFNNDPLRGTH